MPKIREWRNNSKDETMNNQQGTKDVCWVGSLETRRERSFGNPGWLRYSPIFLARPTVARRKQCSEICGILHSSMPIVIESVSIEKFLTWLNEQ